MSDDGSSDGQINVTIKRKSAKKAGFEVEKREEDGFYYITKVPKNCKKIGVGDRVLEINGTLHGDFKSQTNANDLVNSFRLEVVPVDDDDDDDEEEGDDSVEEYEVVNHSRSKTHKNPRTAALASSAVDGSSRSKNTESQSGDDEDESDYGEDWNDGGEMKSEEPDWDDEAVDNNSDSSMTRAAAERNAFVDEEKLKEDKKSWDRQYVSQYKPNDRFMISVSNDNDDDLGIDLVEFQENEIYVREVDQGPFYETALNRGDRIISINGKKIPDHINTVEDAIEILQSNSKLTIFVLRPSEEDEGLNWVIENT